MSEGLDTWGFDIESIEPMEGGGYEDLPAGHYTFEITELHNGGVNQDKKGKPYIMPKMEILDTDQDEKWIGRTYAQYMSLDKDNDRRSYTLNDLQKMGVPAACLKNDGDPNGMVGTVFEADIVVRGNFRNFRNITPAGDAAPEAEEPKAQDTPPPRRRGGSRR